VSDKEFIFDLVCVNLIATSYKARVLERLCKTLVGK